MKKITVIVVDDSALIRSLLAAMIDRQPDMQCIGQAHDPLMAREMIRNLNPDVITLDIEMPRMDGLDFLRRIMQLRPMPVVMVSTLTERGAEVTMRALELGAVDFVAKPRMGVSQGIAQLESEICEKIRAASHARIGKRSASAAAQAAGVVLSPSGPKNQTAQMYRGTERIVAIGASTGGTEAIREVLVELPFDFPAIVITQHMPPGFTKSFAQRLDSLCRMSVREATDGERLLPGHVYIAPGGQHLVIDRSGSNYVARIDNSEPVNRHRPSVDRMFESVAARAGANAIGVMLTGMGKDGAEQMLAMRRAGAHTIAQDEASCVVFGMPREAIAVGAAVEVLPLDRIANGIQQALAARGGHGNRL